MHSVQTLWHKTDYLCVNNIRTLSNSITTLVLKKRPLYNKKTLPMSNEKDLKDKSGKKSPAKNLKEKRSAKMAKRAEKSNPSST
jgi:transcriptional regulator with AAA-type ATPase domain